jgi:hypothetical protein
MVRPSSGYNDSYTGMVTASPGIEPGYIVFPSQKIIMYSFVSVLLSYIKLKKFLAVRRV